MLRCLWQGCLTAQSTVNINSQHQESTSTVNIDSQQQQSTAGSRRCSIFLGLCPSLFDNGATIRTLWETPFLPHAGFLREKFSKVLMKLIYGPFNFLEYIFSACLSPNISNWLWIAEHISIISVGWDSICVITGCKWQHTFVLIMCFLVMSCRQVAVIRPWSDPFSSVLTYYSQGGYGRV